MKHDYTELDTAICSAMTDKPVSFHAISKAVASAAEPFATTEIPAWRIVDRRLQSLCKIGRIRYSRKPEGWVNAWGNAKPQNQPCSQWDLDSKKCKSGHIGASTICRGVATTIPPPCMREDGYPIGVVKPEQQLASGQEPVAWFDEEMQSAYVLEREILAGHEQTTPKD